MLPCRVIRGLFQTFSCFAAGFPEPLGESSDLRAAMRAKPPDVWMWTVECEGNSRTETGQRAFMSTSISVCLIVKNEAQLIGNCLRSIRELAEEMVVVDTGSRDGTAD